jgi:uncharacterized membrane protein YoaK (UPF0700 family)
VPDGDANDAPHPVAYLTLAVALAFVAGCVDAIGFGRVFDVFPANQSGNAVVLGIALGHGDWGGAWRPAVAIVGFGLGVALAIVLGSRVPRRRRPELLVALEILLLGPMAVVVLQDAHPRAQLGGVASGLLVLVTALAMGIQTEVIGRVAGIAVATTYQTGAITRIAEAVARRVAPADRHPAVARGLAILVFVLVAYVGGAAAGAGMGAWRGALFVPIAILIVGTLLLTTTAPGYPRSAVTDS